MASFISLGSGFANPDSQRILEEKFCEICVVQLQ